MRDTAKLESTVALLEWDDHTYLPSGAGAYRAEQVSFLSGLIHQRRTTSELGGWLNDLATSPLAGQRETPEGAAIAGWLRDYRRQVRLPQALVEATAKATSLGQQAWVAARSADRWNDFKPHLHEILNLRRQEAELLADNGQLYDALLDQYEEGARASEITILFAELRDQLVKLLADLQARGQQPSGLSWRRSINLPLQREASPWIAALIGYSFERGRLDETAHPFCTTLGPNDCRILTRYHEDNFPSGFYSTLHEAGHGLYEQGLPSDWYGLPPGAAASLGVHESQSRLWENFIGRSEAFWRWCFPHLQNRFGSAWQELDAEQVFRDANRVEPSLIRVEADEVTYNLHILIRFELEQELITGTLQVDDAPQAWNDRYQRYLGIKPPTAREGILQDVHWSAGLFGYFPTYTLGNLYAAQLMLALQKDLGNVNELLEQGEFEGVLQWLRDKIHVHGRCVPPAELIRRTSGQPLSAEPLVAYLREKLEVAYRMV
ncbi:MAG: carboxypeptidase M32 [Pirellulaceae bacterium]|nr:carboxypeptidase M32 [Pirellulaceae bacterium]